MQKRQNLEEGIDPLEDDSDDENEFIQVT
jgi:hypothetical protein